MSFKNSTENKNVYISAIDNQLKPLVSYFAIAKEVKNTLHLPI
jgi:hypothetical protein